MPPYHSILGHLPVAMKLRSKLPKDIHGQHLFAEMTRTMPELGPVFYFDVWPFAAPTLIVNSPSGIRHMTQEHSLPKFKILAEYLDPLTSGKDLVVLEGEQWKKWRAIFNPGFSASHLVTLVPAIVDDVLTFRDLLRKEVDNNEIFSLEKLTLNLAIDVIGRVTMLVFYIC
jgi:cytochrome P450